MIAVRLPEVANRVLDQLNARIWRGASGRSAAAAQLDRHGFVNGPSQLERRSSVARPTFTRPGEWEHG